MLARAWVVLCLAAVAYSCMELVYVKRDACPDWSYNNSSSNGPAQWGSLCGEYATCSNGTSQSPIALSSTGKYTEVTEKNTDLVTNYQQEQSIVFFNNGHTVEVSNNDTKNTLTLPDGSVYTLEQFHFHDTSEHSLDGVYYPLEMHLVHALGEEDIAVLGWFFKEGASSTLLDELNGVLSQIGEEGSTTVVPMLELNTLVRQPFEFYTYEGSLTTPPCTENVKWFISKTILTGTADQISSIAAVMGLNHRPPQPLNGRVPETYQFAGAEKLNIMFALILALVIVVVIY